MMAREAKLVVAACLAVDVWETFSGLEEVYAGLSWYAWAGN
jgi:hypothetical protein